MSSLRTHTSPVLVLAVAGVAFLALAAVFALTPGKAGAAPIGNGSGPELISDQQDILLNADGRATLDFRDGDNVQSCLSSTPIVVFTPARNLTPGKNAPVTVQAGQNTACSIVIVVLDKNVKPVGSSLVRLTYHAIVKGSADADTPPAPAPTTTTTAP
jgi:hypothetical protein